MSENEYKRVVVCAACKYKDGKLFIGPRHFCPTMWKQVEDVFGGDDKIPRDIGSESEQGFIDQHGVFLTREEAFVVAKEAGQLEGRTKTDWPDSKILYSEDLY
jgi:hypothetical protein